VLLAAGKEQPIGLLMIYQIVVRCNRFDVDPREDLCQGFGKVAALGLRPNGKQSAFAQMSLGRSEPIDRVEAVIVFGQLIARGMIDINHDQIE